MSIPSATTLRPWDTWRRLAHDTDIDEAKCVHGFVGDVPKIFALAPFVRADAKALYQTICAANYTESQKWLYQGYDNMMAAAGIPDRSHFRRVLRLLESHGLVQPSRTNRWTDTHFLPAQRGYAEYLTLEWAKEARWEWTLIQHIAGPSAHGWLKV